MLRDYQKTVYHDIRKAFTNDFKAVLGVLPCRSGKSYIIAEITKNSYGTVLIMAHRLELLEQIKALLEELNIKNVRVASVFTEVKRLGKYAKPSLIIIDEAHLSEAKSYKLVCEYYNAPIIGFTATPSRLDGKKLSLYDCLVEGVSTKELIKEGAIADFEYYAPNIALDFDSVSVSYGEYNNKELTEILCQSKIYGDVIKYYRELGNNQQAICYCASVRHSQMVAELFTSNGIVASSIDGSMRKSVRSEIINAFKNNKIQVLCNCNLISEGITLPNASVGMLLRPTMSLPLYIQQAMRVLTPLEEKKSTIIDFVGNFQRHGLPDEGREWTLEGIQKKRSVNDDGSFIIRRCDKCFKVFKTANKCPYCGYEYETKGRELENMKSVELKKITEEEKQALELQKKQMRMEVGRARTKADLIKIAKCRGYNMKWVGIQMRVKNIRN